MIELRQFVGETLSGSELLVSLARPTSPYLESGSLCRLFYRFTNVEGQHDGLVVVRLMRLWHLCLPLT